MSAEALEYRLDGFALHVSRDSLSYGGSLEQVRLARIATTDGVELQVQVDGAHDLKALYFALEYDVEKYSPTEAVATDAIPGKELLELAVLSDPGVVHHGQVVVHPEAADGLSGDFTLATVTFRSGPAELTRAAALAPVTDFSKSTTNYILGTNTLSWNYACQGDYDQNREVNISDLTPLAAHFGSTSPGGPWPETEYLHQIDGDGNGALTIADITPIGANFQRRVLSYNIYKGLTEDQIPANAEPSTITPIGSVPFDARVGDPASEPLQFSYTPPTEDPEALYWVRPTDGTHEGTPSRPDGGNAVLLTPETTVLGPETGIEFMGEIDADTIELLDPPGGGADVAVGQVLVGVYEDVGLSEFHGVIDRVLSIDSRVGDMVVVTTEPATFNDVFMQGGFSKTADLLNPKLLDLVTKYPCVAGATKVSEVNAAGTVMAKPQAVNGPRFRTISADAARAIEQQRLSAKRTSADSDITLDFSGARLFDKTDGPNYLRVFVDQGTFKWNLPGVDVDYDVGVDWCWFVPCGVSLHHFKAGVSGGIASDLVVRAEGHWEKELAEEAKLYQLDNYYVFAIGPVPVVMRVTVTIFGGVTGEAHADLFAQAGYHMAYGLAMGVQYDGDNWGTFYEPTAFFNPEPVEMTVSGAADLFAYLRGEVTIAFYDVAGGKVSLTPGLQGHADGSIDIPAGEYCLNWNLDGRLRGDLNLFAEVFGLSLFNKTWTIFDLEPYRFASGTIGCGEPASSPPNVYFNGTTGIGPLPVVVTYNAGDESLNPNQDSFDPDSFNNDGLGVKQGITAYYWDLDGDGFCEQMTPGDTPTAMHSYESYGIRKVSVWVVDDDGMIVQKTIDADIGPPIG